MGQSDARRSFFLIEGVAPAVPIDALRLALEPLAPPSGREPLTKTRRAKRASL